jgi:peroxin-2
MFSVPLLPPIPDYLRPAALVAPIKAVFEQPKSIDYSSITLEPSANNEKSSVGSTQAHAGPYASLPLSTCPICYSRRVSKPVSLSDSVSGARISLPRLDQVDGDDVSGEEERMFVPAQTNCWGGCRWCYYCIAGELAEFEAKSTKTAKPAKPAPAAQRGARGVPEEKMEEEVKWDCLRCGGGATKAWRVGGTRPEVESEA